MKPQPAIDSAGTRNPKVDTTLKRNGGLSYLEISAIDVHRAADFYEAVLSWNIDRGDKMQPKFTDQTGHLLGKWITRPTPGGQPGLLPYFYVSQIDHAVQRAIALGGEIVKAPFPEGNLTVSTIRDPSGNLIGLWQQGDE